VHRLKVGVWVVIVMLTACQPNKVEPPPATTEQKAEALEQNAAADGGKMIPPAFEMIKRPEAQAVDPTGDKPLDDAITCLARTIYWEARGEAPAAMEAIANVVMNRLGHEGFPQTVCAVVMQGHEKGGACQFSWWCDGRSDHAREDDSYAIAKEIARRALNLELPDRTGGALYFCQRNVSPSWTSEYIKTTEIGEFAFYKPRGDDAR
jgi:spore germination cell wall hydrolase CwlJ-like protein